MATIAVLGAGIMASSLATPLADNGHRMRLVGTHLDRDIIASIQETGVHPNLGLKLPEGTTAYQLEDAAEAFDVGEPGKVGAIDFAPDEIEINADRPTIELVRVNTGDRPVQIGAH